MRTWSKSHYEDTSLRVAEAGNRLPPIFLILICLAFYPRHFFTPFHKARTFAALDDFLIE